MHHVGLGAAAIIHMHRTVYVQYPDTFHAVNFHHLSAIHLFIFCLCFGALSALMRISLAGDTPGTQPILFKTFYFSLAALSWPSSDGGRQLSLHRHLSISTRRQQRRKSGCDRRDATCEFTSLSVIVYWLIYVAMPNTMPTPAAPRPPCIRV